MYACVCRYLLTHVHTFDCAYKHTYTYITTYIYNKGPGSSNVMAVTQIFHINNSGLNFTCFIDLNTLGMFLK